VKMDGEGVKMEEFQWSNGVERVGADGDGHSATASKRC